MFPIIFGEPEGCIRDVNCSFYWAMGPNNENPNFLDIYLEGDVGGWLAVGFSKNQLMVCCYSLCNHNYALMLYECFNIIESN